MPFNVIMDRQPVYAPVSRGLCRYCWFINSLVMGIYKLIKKLITRKKGFLMPMLESMSLVVANRFVGRHKSKGTFMMLDVVHLGTRFACNIK